MTPAGKLQKYLRERIEALSGQYRKAKWEGRVGCPDCYVWLGEGRYAWIEIKAGADKLSAAQVTEMSRMRQGGLRVIVVRDEGEIDWAIDVLKQRIR
jgi:hypothetical protein